MINTLANTVNTRALYARSITSDITLPQIANVSAVWKFDRQWEFMADAQWTGWSSITDLTFVPTDGSTLPGVPLEWDDTWKIAVGTSYRYNEQWKARFGVAFDQTPVTTHPTARLPDSDRWWLTVGGEYRWTRDWKFDAGLVYIKGDSADFDQRFSGCGSGVARPDPRLVRRERVDPVGAGGVLVLTSQAGRGKPRRVRGHDGRGNPAVCVSGSRESGSVARPARTAHF